VSRASLVETYISALNLTAVRVVASPDGRRCRIETGEPAEGEKIKRQFFFKPSHADLLIDDDRSGRPGRRTAGRRGCADRASGGKSRGAFPDRGRAPPGRRATGRRGAEQEIAGLNTSGELKSFNRRYKLYRQQKAAAGERAMPYSAYLSSLTKQMVQEVARLAG
jgi:hypothetical protein